MSLRKEPPHQAPFLLTRAAKLARAVLSPALWAVARPFLQSGAPAACPLLLRVGGRSVDVVGCAESSSAASQGTALPESWERGPGAGQRGQANGGLRTIANPPKGEGWGGEEAVSSWQTDGQSLRWERDEILESLACSPSGLPAGPLPSLQPTLHPADHSAVFQKPDANQMAPLSTSSQCKWKNPNSSPWSVRPSMISPCPAL